MNFEELSALMRENGIVGAGGAGFPSYAKLNKGVDTIIINCAECEPLLRLHRQLIEKKTYEILYTIDLIAKTIGVNEAVIGIKGAYKNAIASIEANISSFKNIRIRKLREVYPAGDEVVLIYESTGRIVPPGKLPASVGVIVYNVETIFNVYNALNGKPVTHKYVTIAGEVKHPKTYYVPLGTKLSTLIEMSGGETVDNPAYVLGGPMMGYLGKRDEVVTKTTNALIVLPDDHYVIKRKTANIKFDLKKAMAACCQCRYCTDLCPRFNLGHPIHPHAIMNVVSNFDSHNTKPYLDAFFCSGCGLCEMYSCFQGLSPRTIIGEIKSGFKKNGVSAPVIDKAPVPVKDRELRRVPLLRLRARLNIEKYNKSAPIVDDVILPNSVKIMLSQHIGVPAEPIVKIGDHVKDGTLIAKAKENALSVNIHSSIDGKVKEINEKFILIEKEK